MRDCLKKLKHPQLPTWIETDNVTAKGFVHGIVKRKRSKGHSCKQRWPKDRVKEVNIKWAPGITVADFLSKHHVGSHHSKARPICPNEGKSSPTDLQGCVDLLANVQPKARHTCELVLSRQREGSETPCVDFHQTAACDAQWEKLPTEDAHVQFLHAATIKDSSNGPRTSLPVTPLQGPVAICEVFCAQDHQIFKKTKVCPLSTRDVAWKLQLFIGTKKALWSGSGFANPPKLSFAKKGLNARKK